MDQFIQDIVKKRDFVFAKDGGITYEQVGDVPDQATMIAHLVRRNCLPYVGKNVDRCGHVGDRQCGLYRATAGAAPFVVPTASCTGPHRARPGPSCSVKRPRKFAMKGPLTDP